MQAPIRMSEAPEADNRAERFCLAVALDTELRQRFLAAPRIVLQEYAFSLPVDSHIEVFEGRHGSLRINVLPDVRDAAA